MGRAYLGYPPATSEGNAAALSHQRSLTNSAFFQISVIKEVGSGQFIAGMRVLERTQALGPSCPDSSSGFSTSWPYLLDDLFEL